MAIMDLTGCPNPLMSCRCRGCLCKKDALTYKSLGGGQ
jgi:hypothetical protein